MFLQIVEFAGRCLVVECYTCPPDRVVSYPSLQGGLFLDVYASGRREAKIVSGICWSLTSRKIEVQWWKKDRRGNGVTIWDVKEKPIVNFYLLFRMHRNSLFYLTSKTTPLIHFQKSSFRQLTFSFLFSS